MLKKIIIFYEQVCRFLYYGWNMRNAYEFDSSSVELAQHYSLLRLKKFMESDKTHLAWNDSKDTKLMKRLAEAVKLSGELLKIDDGTSHKHYSKLRKKYKPKKKNDTLSFIDKLYDTSETKEIDDKLFTFMLRKAFKKDNTVFLEKKKRFEYLMSKYLKHWWD